jgi:lipid II:glycine glycyltransferase (peptidoglycan interpeptide bridge formation enzyme)
MSYEVMSDNINREQWEKFANHFADHSLYQTWAYQKARTGKRNQRISDVEISDDNGTRLLALTRIIKVPLIGLRIGYIQWGPLLRRQGQSACLDSEALKCLRDHCLSKWVDVLRITPNIYTTEVGEDYKEVMTSAGFERVHRIKPYHTMLFPLDIDQEQMRMRFHNKWRAALRKAEKNGMTVHETQDAQMLSQFEEIYKKSIQKKKFKGLNVSEFIQTQQKLQPSQKLNMIVIKKENDLLSVDINSYLGDTALGLFQSTTEQGLSLGASYLAWWHTFLAAKRAGMRRYDMGGIDPVGNPNVYQFKLRMGGDEAFHLGCFDAYADKWAKCLCIVLDHIYQSIKRKR